MNVSDREFADLFRTNSPEDVAKMLGIKVRSVYLRRQRIEQRTGRAIHTPNAAKQKRLPPPKIPGRLNFEVENGIILVGSDAHFWPGIVTTAWRGMLKFAKDMKPAAIVLNGDMFDGAGVSRHPPIGWEKYPTVKEELDVVAERLAEMEKAAPRSKKFWTLGNHDARYETYLAANVPQYQGVNGTRLKDHFPRWEPCWSTWVNDAVVIKHRYGGGDHATHNNAVKSGKTMVTGHLHGGKATPFTDYNGTRWGVDAGTLAEPYGPQFEYQEDNPRNHRSGFAVLPFRDGRMLQPLLALVHAEREIDFCGKVYRV